MQFKGASLQIDARQANTNALLKYAGPPSVTVHSQAELDAIPKALAGPLNINYDMSDTDIFVVGFYSVGPGEASISHRFGSFTNGAVAIKNNDCENTLYDLNTARGVVIEANNTTGLRNVNINNTVSVSSDQSLVVAGGTVLDISASTGSNVLIGDNATVTSVTAYEGSVVAIYDQASVGNVNAAGGLVVDNRIGNPDDTYVRPSKLGDLNSLTTADKTSAVAAINEVNAKSGFSSSFTYSGTSASQFIHILDWNSPASATHPPDGAEITLNMKRSNGTGVIKGFLSGVYSGNSKIFRFEVLSGGWTDAAIPTFYVLPATLDTSHAAELWVDINRIGTTGRIEAELFVTVHQPQYMTVYGQMAAAPNIASAIHTITPQPPISGTFSASETLTGKIWTNGKPIYRRAFTGRMTAAANVPGGQALTGGVDELISCGGWWQTGADAAKYAVCTQLTNGSALSDFNLDSSGMTTFRTLSNTARDGTNNCSYAVWLEYTKV